MKRNCETCQHCWKDCSVGDRDCMVLEKFSSDEEVEKYFADAEDGCPLYEHGDGITKVGYKF